MKFLLLALLAVLGWMLLKKIASSGGAAPSTPARPAIRKPLSEAQSTMFTKLQAALPTTMVLVQPALSQLFDARGTDAALVPDFAICKRDASPIGVVLLDATPDAQRIESLALAAGLRVARFRSSRLPGDQDIKDALGFL